MFSFSLGKRHKALEVELCRLLDQNARTVADRRIEGRARIIRPVMVAPEFQGKPATSEVQFGLTTDISTRGCAAYLGSAIASGTAYVGLHFNDETKIFRATVKSRAEASGGFQRVGLEFIKMADPGTPGISILQALSDELR